MGFLPVRGPVVRRFIAGSIAGAISEGSRVVLVGRIQSSVHREGELAGSRLMVFVSALFILKE